MAFIFGYHAVREQLSRAPSRIHRLVVLAESRDRRRTELIQNARDSSIRVQMVSRAALDRMTDGARHQGLIAEIQTVTPVSEDAFKQAFLNWANPFILVLEDVQDPHNLGACLRTAAAVGVDAVLLPRNRSAPLSDTVAKAASGTLHTLFIVQIANLARTLDWLKSQAVWIVGTDQSAEQSYLSFDFNAACAIVLGNEHRGLRRLTRELCDHLVRIPISNAVDSLNVSVANGVVLFEVNRQRTST